MAEELSYVDAVRAEIDKQLGWTPQQVHAAAWDHAVTIAMGVVGPILESWEQRLGDVREEYRKSLESWDRSRTRLDATIQELRAGWRDADQQHARDVELLLWLHAEAVHWMEFQSAAAESAEEDNDRLRLENKRLRREVEFEANGADTFSGADRIHCEAREEGEEGGGRVDTGQAGREEAAEQTVGTGYPQGSGPGRGSATPAPLSSRPQCAVHPDGQGGGQVV